MIESFNSEAVISNGTDNRWKRYGSYDAYPRATSIHEHPSRYLFTSTAGLQLEARDVRDMSDLCFITLHYISSFYRAFHIDSTHR